MTGEPVRRRRLHGRCSLCGKGIDPSCQWVHRPGRAAPAAQPGRSCRLGGGRRSPLRRGGLVRGRRKGRLDRLATLGRAVRVGLVGCAKQKRAGTHLARDLYTSRSSASRRVAERTCDEVFILSALHELVDLAQPLRSYDRRLSRLDK